MDDKGFLTIWRQMDKATQGINDGVSLRSKDTCEPKKMRADEIKREASGRWLDILGHLGISDNYLTGRHGPCPFCGGKDRFRFTNYNDSGLWICNQCGSGDGFDLLQQWHGWNFSEVCRQVKTMIPGSHVTTKQDDRGDAVKALRRIQDQARDAGDCQPVIDYLTNRGLSVPPMLQALPSMGYYEGGKKIAEYPVMLGKVYSDRKPVSYHRTYIGNGNKAPVGSPRKMMKPAKKVSRYMIPLWPHENKLVIAEGIETAIACYELWNIPAWSVVSATSMEKFNPPDGVTHICIAGDNDKNYTGQKAAYHCANRLAIAGYEVVVKIPSKLGDWNDVLIERLSDTGYRRSA